MKSAGLAHLTGPSADARLADLLSRRAFSRPWLGAHAERMVERRGYERLGFRSLDDWSRERLGVSARTVREWARVSRQLRELPLLRAAVLSGEVPWSVAGRIGSLATPDNDAACLETVRGRTVLAVETILRALRPQEPADSEGESEPRESLRLDCPPELRAHWRGALELGRRMAGQQLATWQVAEAIAAEVVAAAGAPPSIVEAEHSRRPAARDQAHGLRAKRWRGLSWGAGRGMERLPSPEQMDRLLAGAPPRALEASMRQTLGDRQRTDFEIGRILARVVGRRLHRELGFATFDEYVRERLDLSPRTARRLVRIARAEGAAREAGGEVANAFRAGRITGLQAELLLRGGGATVANACRVTLRRLEQEAPPPLVFQAPRSVARLFRPLVRQYGLRKLLEHALATWLEAGRLVKDYADFARDGWRCTVPGCSARANLQSHHVVYRSRGGPHQSWNRTTLCAFHHLRGVHAGLIRIRGRAPDRLVYRLGFGTFASGDLRL